MKEPKLNLFGLKSPVYPIIQLADSINEISWLSPQVLSDFVDGLAFELLGILKGDITEEDKRKYELLTKPVYDFMRDFRNRIIDSEVSGEERFTVNGIDVLITRDEIIRQARRSKERILRTRADVVETIKDFIAYKKDVFGSVETTVNVVNKGNNIKQKTIFNPESIDAIFELLKNFFDANRHIELKHLLDTGEDVIEPLIFLDSGGRLADAFKQLIKSDLITGCDQSYLESWIFRNFKYFYRGKVMPFNLKYLNDVISTNKDKCQKPILNIIISKDSGKLLIRKA